MTRKVNYFKKNDEFYTRYLSAKQAAYIRFDARGITSRREYVLSSEKDPFVLTIQQAAITMSSRFHCVAYTTMDELNLVFDDPEYLFRIAGGNSVQKIASCFAQKIYRDTNIERDSCSILGEHGYIEFDVKTASIRHDKIEQYIFNRLSSGRNTMVYYHAKYLIPPNEKINCPLSVLIQRVQEKEPDFKDDYRGYLYKDGKQLNMRKYFKNKLWDQSKYESMFPETRFTESMSSEDLDPKDYYDDLLDLIDP